MTALAGGFIGGVGRNLGGRIALHAFTIAKVGVFGKELKLEFEIRRTDVASRHIDLYRTRVLTGRYCSFLRCACWPM